MSPTPLAEGQALSVVDLAQVGQALRGNGLWLDVGAATVHVRSNSAQLAADLQRTYPAFPLVTTADWADVHVQVEQVGGMRRWLRPQVRLVSDGLTPFYPFPASDALPMFEWACNWLIGQRLNDVLLLHAGALERDGLALLLPATPGSGKSTLTSAMTQRGWRLLSDEFGAFDPQIDAFRAMLKPVALKNQSIDVIRRFAPTARFGPTFLKTRKGDVSHLAAAPEAVRRRHEPARPGGFILPRWEAGSATELQPLSETRLFPALAFNAFNYGALGAAGFQAVLGLVRRCPGWQLVYSDLDDAIRAIDALWPQVLARHAALIAA